MGKVKNFVMDGQADGQMDGGIKFNIPMSKLGTIKVLT